MPIPADMRRGCGVEHPPVSKVFENGAPTDGGEDLSRKRIFTTGEAAAICKVSQQTIIRCFDSGRLGGFRVPGSKFRRIPREELIKFMRANGISTTPLEGTDRRRILVVDDDVQMTGVIQSTLVRDERNEVRCVHNAYDAGIQTEAFRPHLLILELMLPDLRCETVCTRLRENPEYASMKVLGISAATSAGTAAMTAGAHAFLCKPFTTDALVEAVDGLLAAHAAGESVPHR
jgi:two-component system OmpR family response regulator